MSSSTLPSSGQYSSSGPEDDYGGQWRGRRRRRHRLALIIGVVMVVIAVIFLLWIILVANGYLASPTPYRPFLGVGFLGVFLIIIIAFWCIRIAFWSTRSWGGGGRGYYGGGYGRGRPYNNYGGGQGGGLAMATARQRYASGEITREQYQQIVQDLRNSKP